MLVRFVLWSSLIISWASVFYINKKDLKRYMPVGIFSSLLVIVVYEIGSQLGWWKLQKTIASWMKVSDLSLVFGPFLVGTIWVFNLTYKRGIIVYTIINVVLDAFYSFVFLPFLEKTEAVKLKKVSRLGIFGLMQIIAFIIYPYQRWQESLINHEPKEIRENLPQEIIPS